MPTGQVLKYANLPSIEICHLVIVLNCTSIKTNQQASKKQISIETFWDKIGCIFGDPRLFEH